MYSWDTQPIFCFTSDIDWASEEVIKFSHDVLSADNLKITYFNTHPSPYLNHLKQSEKAKILIHPNFLSDSSHGSSYEDVINFCLNLCNDADGFRCHRYFEVNDIMDMFIKRGFKFVSNHCTQCETFLRPLKHRSGLLSIPIFLEDGGHLLADPSLNFNRLMNRLSLPGLKVINFHPAHIAFNTPNFFYTRTIKDSMSRQEWNEIDHVSIKKLENKKMGIRNLIQDIINFIESEGSTILSMHEIYHEHQALYSPLSPFSEKN